MNSDTFSKASAAQLQVYKGLAAMAEVLDMPVGASSMSQCAASVSISIMVKVGIDKETAMVLLSDMFDSITTASEVVEKMMPKTAVTSGTVH